MKTVFNVGICGVLILLCIAAFLLWSDKEPTYQGRRISRIMDDQASRKAGALFHEAIPEIGTNAIPYAVRHLARNDSVLRNKYQHLFPKLPRFVQKIMPSPRPALSDVDGANVFYYVGSPAIPQGVALLKHQSPTVRRAAAWGLGAIRRKSSEGNLAIPALIEALADSDSRVRCLSAISLQKMGTAASNAVPALDRIVADANADIALRAAAARTLGTIGPGATNAIPTLGKALETPNAYLRGQTAVALWRITREVDTALPVLLQEMPRENEHSKWDWIIALGEMGPRARPALQQLEQELTKDKEVWVLQYVTNALLKIDPEAARRMGVVSPPKLDASN